MFRFLGTCRQVPMVCNKMHSLVAGVKAVCLALRWS
jgi:hypothetical protein